MDLTSTENRPQEPQKEKQLAWFGVSIGILVGAMIGAVVFYLPSVFTSFPYQRMLIIVGAIAGGVQGGYLWPLVMLRMSQWLGQRSSTAR